MSVMLPICNGVIIELIPNINVMLNILEPIMFPNANSVFFLNAAVSDATNSGKDVPHAISVIDINAWSTPSCSAIASAESTK